MTELEKVAREYCKNVKQSTGRESDPENAFQAGAMWQAEQSPWISVECMSPTKKSEVLLKTSFGHRMIGVFVDTHTYERQIGGSPLDWEKVSTKLAITHWMPIPE